MKKKVIQRINLKEIKNPDFLQNLNYAELNALSEDIADYIIESTSKNGGHLSSNLGVVDATIALCRAFDFSKDKIIFDVGHQCYTYKVLTGRTLDTLRQKDGTAGFQKIDESPYDHFECGHSSTSISVANGMAIARDLNHEHYDIVAFIGDSSIVNGLSMEALNNSADGHKIIIVLNDNDMSIGKPVGGVANIFRSFSTSGFYRKSKNVFKRMLQATKLGRKLYGGFANVKNWWKRHLMNLNVFDTLGYSSIGPIDGHNIKAVEKALLKAKKTEKSVVVHIRTIKGKGYKYAESDTRGVWHGVGKFDIDTGAIESKTDTWSWSEIYKECILKRMRDDKDSVLIVPATQLGSALTDVFEEFPKRCIDVGIAEEHAVTMSGGLSISGKHPIISIYSTFLQRAYDQVSHDIARIGLNATILIDRAGLVGNDGGTHQGLYDESFLMGIPNTVVAMASNSAQANALMEETKNPHGVFCIRYPRSYATLTRKVENIPFGSWKKELKGEGTALVSLGPETEIVKELIKKKKLNVSLYNAIYQKPMDEKCVKELLDYERVIIYDAYATETGFANALCAKLIELGYKGKAIVKTVPTDFVRHASIIQQEAKFGLLPEDIVKLI